MLGFIAISLLIIPMALLSHPDWARLGYHFVVPSIAGGATSDSVLLIIAIVGTTVAPWQLFFQQSNVIDKRITPRFIGYERADTVIGSIVVVVGAAALILTAAYAATSTGAVGKFTDALGVAHALGRHSHLLGAIFAVVLLDASIVGAAAVTLATSYAFGDVFNLRHSLHRGFTEAKGFYASYTGMVLTAAGIVLIPGAPLGLITTGVQALAGLLLPSASVFLLLLCNDLEVLGPWVNPRWLNALAATIIAALLGLSAILMTATLFPDLPTTTAVITVAAVLAIGLAATGLTMRMLRRRGRATTAPSKVDRRQRPSWRMPPLALLKPTVWSPATKLGMSALRGYLVLAAILLIVKAIQVSAS
jgi:Mn2+/Fe2+ NRAMP family transporter